MTARIRPSLAATCGSARPTPGACTHAARSVTRRLGTGTRRTELWSRVPVQKKGTMAARSPGCRHQCPDPPCLRHPCTHALTRAAPKSAPGACRLFHEFLERIHEARARAVEVGGPVQDDHLRGANSADPTPHALDLRSGTLEIPPARGEHEQVRRGRLHLLPADR